VLFVFVCVVCFVRACELCFCVYLSGVCVYGVDGVMYFLGFSCVCVVCAFEIVACVEMRLCVVRVFVVCVMCASGECVCGSIYFVFICCGGCSVSVLCF